MGGMTWGGFRVLLCAAAAIAAPVSFGATDDQGQVQATILDHGEFMCRNCLFGVSDFYLCFDANNKVLIGHDRVRTQTWQKNPVDLLERGKTVSIRYDDKFIWVSRPGQKDLKLRQDYSKKLFMNSERCLAATK
jgi:hypothetical protein